MDIKDKKASVIFENHENKFLLQKRDEEPEFDKWVLFGGSVEEGESDIEAAKREILEELNYTVKDITLFKKYVHGTVEQIIYIAGNKVDIKDLELHEGSDMNFFSRSELENIDIGFNYKEILNDYLENKNLINI